MSLIAREWWVRRCNLSQRGERQVGIRDSVCSKDSNEGVKATAAYISATARPGWHKIVPSWIVRKSWMWIDPVHMSSVMRSTRRIQCPHVPRTLLRCIRLSLAFYRSGICQLFRISLRLYALIERFSIFGFRLIERNWSETLLFIFFIYLWRKTYLNLILKH